MSTTSELPTKNRILSALPAGEYERLIPHLKPFTLEYKQVLHEPNKPLRYVYFPDEGVISMVSTMIDKPVVEVGLAGREGMVCVAVFLGANSTPHQGIVQVAGSAMRMKASVLREEFKRGGKLQELLLRYTQMQMIQIAQTAVCNRLHMIEGQLSRWLLMIHDRVDGDEFLLTQDIISLMLGVQRTGVTGAAGILQRKGMIRYVRGKITILDRQALEETACECYWIVKDAFDRLVGTR